MSYAPPSYETVDPGYCEGVPTTISWGGPQIGNCPACRQSDLKHHITFMGLCCAIFLFPCGLICLLLLREERCSNCGYCK